MVQRRAKTPTTEVLLGEAEKNAPGLRAVTEDERQSGNMDLGDAEVSNLFADAIAAQYCWTAGWGWLRWDGKRWARVTDAEVLGRAKKWVLEQYNRAWEGTSKEATELWHKYRGKSRLEAVVSLARSNVIQDVGKFDKDPDLLNVSNGVVDLRTGELLPHDPARLMTKLAPAGYLPGAEHPDWKSALEALPDDIHDWYQVRLGQAITGHMTPDDVALFQRGGGENGKGTIWSGIQVLLGDYLLVVPHKALLASASDHSTEVACFQGVRVAIMEELPEEHKLNIVRLKTLTGTHEITARLLYHDNFTFSASHSLFVSCNRLPVINDTDHGTWRRLELVRFPYTFRKPGEETGNELERPGDPALRDRLHRGGDGRHEAILAWMVEGSRKWYASGRVMPPLPERIKRDKHEWELECDLVLRFVDERLVFDPAAHIMSAELTTEFNNWLEQLDHHRWSETTFAVRFGGHREVSRRGVEKKKKKRDASLSRPGHTPGSPPESYAAWLGLRFQDPDKGPDD